jgi:hypothetical protein
MSASSLVCDDLWEAIDSWLPKVARSMHVPASKSAPWFGFRGQRPPDVLSETVSGTTGHQFDRLPPQRTPSPAIPGDGVLCAVDQEDADWLPSSPRNGSPRRWRERRRSPVAGMGGASPCRTFCRTPWPVARRRDGAAWGGSSPPAGATPGTSGSIGTPVRGASRGGVTESPIGHAWPSRR